MNRQQKLKWVSRLILGLFVVALLVALTTCTYYSNQPATQPIESDDPIMSEEVETGQPSAQPTATPTPTPAPTPTATPDVTPTPTEPEPVQESGEPTTEPVESQKQPNVVPTQRPNWPVNPPQQSQAPEASTSTEPSQVPTVSVVIKVNDDTSVYGECINELSYTVKEANGVTANELEQYIILFKQRGTDAGTYVTSGTCTNPNWHVTFENGTYTITKRPIVVSIDSKSSYLGSNLQELTCKLESGTLAQKDELQSIVKLSTNADKNKAGRYSIVGTVLSKNYNVTFKGATYSVQNRSYDEEPSPTITERPSHTPTPSEEPTPSTPIIPPPPPINTGNTESGGGSTIGGGETAEPTPTPTPSEEPTPSTPVIPPPPPINTGNTESGGGSTIGGGESAEPTPSEEPTPSTAVVPPPPPVNTGGTEGGGGGAIGGGN